MKERAKKRDLIEECIKKFSQELLEKIKTGDLVWKKNWEKFGATKQTPHNPCTGSFYDGWNLGFALLTMAVKGYETGEFLTFNNIQKLGGRVKKGEKAITMLKYGVREFTEEQKKNIEEFIKRNNLDKEEQAIFIMNQQRGFLTGFSVFNIAQTEGITAEALLEYQKKNGVLEKIKESEERRAKFDENAFVETIAKNSEIPIFAINTDRAYYNPSKDIIVIPSPESFFESKYFYSTLLHELGHSTGHKSRLDRDLRNKFGTEEYAKEELRAELFSFFQGRKLNLDFDEKNHLSYIKDWQKITKEEELIEIVRDALKISTYVEKNWYPLKSQMLEMEKQNVKSDYEIIKRGFTLDDLEKIPEKSDENTPQRQEAKQNKPKGRSL